MYTRVVLFIMYVVSIIVVGQKRLLDYYCLSDTRSSTTSCESSRATVSEEALVDDEEPSAKTSCLTGEATSC